MLSYAFLKDDNQSFVGEDEGDTLVRKDRQLRLNSFSVLFVQIFQACEAFKAAQEVKKADCANFFSLSVVLLVLSEFTSRRIVPSYLAGSCVTIEGQYSSDEESENIIRILVSVSDVDSHIIANIYTLLRVSPLIVVTGEEVGVAHQRTSVLQFDLSPNTVVFNHRRIIDLVLLGEFTLICPLSFHGWVFDNEHALSKRFHGSIIHDRPPLDALHVISDLFDACRTNSIRIVPRHVR